MRGAILVDIDKVLNAMQKPKSLWRWSVNPWPIDTMWIFTSLVPRPSHHPVFDHLQYAKMKGEGLVHFYHVNDFSVYLGIQQGGVGGGEKNELEP